MLVKFEQYENKKSSILVMLFGIVILISFEQ